MIVKNRIDILDKIAVLENHMYTQAEAKEK